MTHPWMSAERERRAAAKRSFPVPLAIETFWSDPTIKRSSVTAITKVALAGYKQVA